MEIDVAAGLADALVLCERGEPDAAGGILEQLVDTAPAVPGAARTDTVICICRLCDKLAGADQLLPLSMVRKVAAAATETLGPKHIQSLAIRMQLAAVMMISGQPDEARTVAEALLDDFEAELGVEHPLTVQCALVLVGVYSRIGDVPAGRALVLRVPGVLTYLMSGGA